MLHNTEEFNKLINNKDNKEIESFIIRTNTQAYANNKDNYIKIFGLILSASDKVDIPHKHNITPLMFATEINDEYIVKELLKKGANQDYYNDAHSRAYDYAIANNNMILAELLE